MSQDTQNLELNQAEMWSLEQIALVVAHNLSPLFSPVPLLESTRRCPSSTPLLRLSYSPSPPAPLTAPDTPLYGNHGRDA